MTDNTLHSISFFRPFEEFNISEYDIIKPISIHSHDFLEIAYIKKGEVLHTIDGKTNTLKEGTYIVIDYGISHSFDKVFSKNCEVINLLFKPSILDKTLTKCTSFKDMFNNYLINLNNTPFEQINIFTDEDKSILQIFDNMMFEYTNRTIGYRQIIFSKIFELIIHTIRKTAAHQMINGNGDIQKAINLIEDCFNTEIKLSDIAKELNTSVSNLCRNFKTVTGINFHTYLQKKRIDYAKTLLLTTNKRIVAISLLCGYADFKHFSKLFKSHTGLSPMLYRKTNI